MLEALQIAEKLVADFKAMRQEVYSRLYDIQENGLNKKADHDHVHQMETQMQNGFEKLHVSHRKYKDDMAQSIRNITERMKKQTFMNMAASPNPEIDASAMLSKRHDKGSK